MTKKKEITEVVETPVEQKNCMTYIKSIKTKSFEIFKGQKAKLTQSEIEQMHDEIKITFPKISDWVANTPK